MLIRIRDEVRGGATLSAALASQSGVFSRLYLSMVRAGEAGGALGKVLLRLSEHLERADELRATVVSALIYPTILVAVSVISVMTLLIFVVPQFTQLLEESGKTLPLPTQIVVNTGNFLRAYWWAILAVGAGAVYLFRRGLQDPGRAAALGRLAVAPAAGRRPDCKGGGGALRAYARDPASATASRCSPDCPSPGRRWATPCLPKPWPGSPPR